jgi:hypothetical protein
MGRLVAALPCRTSAKWRPFTSTGSRASSRASCSLEATVSHSQEEASEPGAGSEEAAAAAGAAVAAAAAGDGGASASIAISISTGATGGARGECGAWLESHVVNFIGQQQPEVPTLTIPHDSPANTTPFSLKRSVPHTIRRPHARSRRRRDNPRRTSSSQRAVAIHARGLVNLSRPRRVQTLPTLVPFKIQRKGEIGNTIAEAGWRRRRRGASRRSRRWAR